LAVAGSEGQAERSRDLERFLTFVDAIAAVAITLLILPLVDLAGEVRSGDESVWHLLTTHSGQFWSFGLSFGVIARLWLAQHRLMRPVIAANVQLTTCLMLWVLAIVFLPFPTALLPGGGRETITKALYLGTLTACSACLLLVSLVVGRNRSLRDSDERPLIAPDVTIVGIFVVALAISLIVPAAEYYPLLLLFLSGPITRLVGRVESRGRRSAQ
jgi:uncharacterized membrane protein